MNVQIIHIADSEAGEYRVYCAGEPLSVFRCPWLALLNAALKAQDRGLSIEMTPETSAAMAELAVTCID